MNGPTYVVQIRVVETNVSKDAPKPMESFNDETITLEMPRSVATDPQALELFLRPAIHHLADALRNT